MLAKFWGRGEGWWVDANIHEELDDSSTLTHLHLDLRLHLSPSTHQKHSASGSQVFLKSPMWASIELQGVSSEIENYSWAVKKHGFQLGYRSCLLREIQQTASNRKVKNLLKIPRKILPKGTLYTELVLMGGILTLEAARDEQQWFHPLHTGGEDNNLNK